MLPLGMLACGTGYQILSSRMVGQEAPTTTRFYTSWIAARLVSAGDAA